MRQTVSLIVAVAMLAAVGAIGATVRPAHADSLPSLRVGDARVIEGDAGKEVVNVPIDLSAPSAVKVTVQYAIRNATATAGSDFIARSGKIGFLPGVTSKQLSVVVLGDTVVEPDELVNVHLSSALNATIADADGGVTIVDDDSDSSQSLQVNVGDVTVTANPDGTHYASLPITLSAPAPSTIKVYYAVSCGVTEEGITVKQSATLTFLAGQQTKQLTFKVPLEQSVDDALSILATLKVTKGPAVLHRRQGVGTIVGSGTGIGGLPVGGVQRASVASDGSEAQFSAAQLCGGYTVRGSLQAAISGDGRYVAFTSDATNLVPEDTNGLVDVFVRDNDSGNIERVSLRSDGSEVPYDGANDMNTAYPSISADGRYVTFESERPLTNEKVAGGLYLFDRVTRQVELVSKGTDGEVSGANLYGPLSDDGRFVAFESEHLFGFPIMQPTLNQSADWDNVFVRDRLTGTTTWVNQPYNGGWTNATGTAADISGDGRYIAWMSNSPNFVPGDTNNCNDIFVRDMESGSVERASVTSDGGDLGACAAGAPALSADGRFVTFAASVGVETEIFVHDNVDGTTEQITDGPLRAANEPDISGDGRYVTYRWLDMTTGDWAINLFDRDTGETSIVGQLADGTLPDGDVGDGFDWFKSGSISRDGNYVAFTSDATNLVPNDQNDSKDVFVQRLH